MALLALLSVPGLLVWLVLAVSWSVVRLIARGAGRRWGRVPGGSVTGWLLTVVALGAVIATVTDEDLFTAAMSPPVVLVALIAAVVLLADRLTVHFLSRSFRFGSFTPYPDFASLSRWERLARTSGRRRFAADLDRIAAAPTTGELVVHRGRKPFVGTGATHRSWSMVIELEPDEGPPDACDTDNGLPSGPRQARFKASHLYEHVAGEITALGASPSLSPSWRMKDLVAAHRVIVSAEALLFHHHDPAAQAVLPRPEDPPAASLPPPLTTEVINQPCEWMRYYRCFQVESWDRDLVVSAYLHVSVDDRTLYLEWTACVLHPVADAYRQVDLASSSPWPPMRDALASLIELPLTVPTRIASVIRMARNPRAAHPVTPAGRYGCASSLRELAASARVRSYFQQADVDRYIKLIERRAVLAVHGFLTTRGISTGSLDKQITAIINNTTVTHSTVVGSTIGGSSNEVTNAADATSAL
jgi:hypothetical protein